MWQTISSNIIDPSLINVNKCISWFQKHGNESCDLASTLAQWFPPWSWQDRIKPSHGVAAVHGINNWIVFSFVLSNSYRILIARPSSIQLRQLPTIYGQLVHATKKNCLSWASSLAFVYLKQMALFPQKEFTSLINQGLIWPTGTFEVANSLTSSKVFYQVIRSISLFTRSR